MRQEKTLMQSTLMMVVILVPRLPEQNVETQSSVRGVLSRAQNSHTAVKKPKEKNTWAWEATFGMVLGKIGQRDG